MSVPVQSAAGAEGARNNRDAVRVRLRMLSGLVFITSISVR